MKALLVLLLSILAVGLAGCGAGSGGGSCSYFQTFTVTPATAAVDHSATPPKNQQQFTADVGEGATGQMCAVANIVAIDHPTWTNPDPLDISISSANDSTNGLATCMAATNGPVSLTATNTSVSTPQSATVQLTCQ